MKTDDSIWAFFVPFVIGTAGLYYFTTNFRFFRTKLCVLLNRLLIPIEFVFLIGGAGLNIDAGIMAIVTESLLLVTNKLVLDKIFLLLGAGAKPSKLERWLSNLYSVRPIPPN